MEDWHDQKVQAKLEGNDPQDANVIFTFGVGQAGFLPVADLLTPQQNLARVRRLNTSGPLIHAAPSFATAFTHRQTPLKF